MERKKEEYNENLQIGKSEHFCSPDSDSYRGSYFQ